MLPKIHGEDVDDTSSGDADVDGAAYTANPVDSDGDNEEYANILSTMMKRHEDDDEGVMDGS